MEKTEIVDENIGKEKSTRAWAKEKARIICSEKIVRIKKKINHVEMETRTIIEKIERKQTTSKKTSLSRK